ncbi:ABC transporter permease [Hyperthermus butylicus]|uniref:ABC-type tungstate transport system, periplasmic component, TupA n=1 Tax=Hyperthermus butylicus (strain DSM 5456 / JCM 9403 / PLM1-5) TaxID=415426 RepID=A2BJP5_HYPBU|nr:ABC transporter permease [Hyperthermus butylicus]ABM80206.1 ABC-type tungstate transport system, periplasmic component, TupA [Hyperthermus butylicus DSM 5456]
MGELGDIVFRSIYVSGTATLLASLWSIPLAYLIASRRRLQALAPILEALVGIPTVLVGLLLYMLLSRSGPLGFLDLLYTPQAIIIGEAVLVTPLVTSVAYRVLRHGFEVYGELAYSLGATSRQAMITVVREALPGLVASVVMGFSRAIGELGVAFMVGGNIKGYTRTLTTAIALGVSMGEYEFAMRLGAVLLAITLLVSLVARLVQRLWA